MLNNWQRLIVAFAAINLNLYAIAQVEPEKTPRTDKSNENPVDSTEENTNKTCSDLPSRPPKLRENNPNSDLAEYFYEKIQFFGSTLLSVNQEDMILDIESNEERDETGINSAMGEIKEIREQLGNGSFTEESLKEKAEKLADEITKLYLYSGYITSKAEVKNKNTGTKEIQIQITEGYLEEIRIKQDKNRVSKSYICSRILRAVDAPINITKLEKQLQLMNSNPLFKKIDAELEAIGTTQISKLTVDVKEAKPFSISLSADNYSPPSIGSERLGVNIRYLNLLGIEDEIAGSYVSSTTGGAELFDFTYKIPLDAKNATLLFRAAPNSTEVTQSPFDAFGIEGEKEIYEFTYRQPLIRKLKEEFALSLGFIYQEGQTFLGDVSTPFGIGPDEDGFSRTSTIQFTQDYTSIDGGGIWSLRSQFNLGIGLFDATTNDAPIPDGHFFSWFAQVQRGQRLSPNNLLVIQADLQLTPNSLLPSQQFVMGGGQSIRGYRQNARSGDNGFRFSIEDRITVDSSKEEDGHIIQLAPFVDLGVVWNEPNNPNQLLDEQFLLGMGLGLQFKNFIGINGLDLRFDYGIPLVEIEDRGNNIQDDGLYFQVNFQP